MRLTSPSLFDYEGIGARPPTSDLTSIDKATMGGSPGACLPNSGATPLSFPPVVLPFLLAADHWLQHGAGVRTTSVI